MYKVKISKKQETNSNKAKSVLPSTRLKVASSFRRPSNRDSPFKNSVLSNTKKSFEKVEVFVRTNKKTYVAYKNVVSNKKVVTDVDVKNALKVKDVSCVSCAKNVLILCHDKCLMNYKLNVHSKVRRALFTTPRIAKYTCEDTTPVVSKTRFSVKTTQSKSIDTIPVVSKTKIAAITPLSAKNKVVQIILCIVYSGCSKHMTGDHSLLENFVEKFMGTVRFGNDHFAAITGYGNYVQGNITVCHIYYVEEGDDLLTGAHESNLYTISISDMAASSPVCLMSKATSTKSCTHSKLELLHMDLCGPMRVASINGKKYILVIIDDYSRFTWVYFLHTKDETPEIIKKFIAQAHYEKLGIMQQFSIAQMPQQNGVVERRNRTLVEVARTMLIFSQLPEFLWAEAISTACFTQNRLIIHTMYNKTPYELLHGRKPNVEYVHVFGSLCYPTNDQDDRGKMKPKADNGIFVGYSETSRGF
ncbi:retrovirus-related pol polyprotein from transposon TNT 1-94 [Tanacetum coccineum]